MVTAVFRGCQAYSCVLVGQAVATGRMLSAVQGVMGATAMDQAQPVGMVAVVATPPAAAEAMVGRVRPVRATGRAAATEVTPVQRPGAKVEPVVTGPMSALLPELPAMVGMAEMREWRQEEMAAMVVHGGVIAFYSATVQPETEATAVM